MKKTNIDRNELVNFLSTAKNLPQLCHHYSLSSEDMVNHLNQRERLVGRELFAHRNSAQERIYIYVPVKKMGYMDVKPKIWTPRISKTQPWIWIKFSNSFNAKKIILAPISDTHYGAESHMYTEFDEYLNYIKNTRNVFGFIVGDMLENAHFDSPPGAIFDQTIRPGIQMEQFQKKLRPLAHKILFGTIGNHEARSTKKADIDPLDWAICRPLGIPYFNEPVYIDLLWKGYEFRMFCQHGGGGARTKGGKINRALEPTKFQEHVHFNIMGHVHDPMAIESIRICRERKYNDRSQLENFRLVQKKQYTIIAPSFLKYFGSYGARSGYSPPNYGITGCEIYPNGKYNTTN